MPPFLSILQPCLPYYQAQKRDTRRVLVPDNISQLRFHISFLNYSPSSYPREERKPSSQVLSKHLHNPHRRFTHHGPKEHWNQGPRNLFSKSGTFSHFGLLNLRSWADWRLIATAVRRPGRARKVRWHSCRQIYHWSWADQDGLLRW